MTNLIGISGKAGSGKDLIASIIQYLIWIDNVEKGVNKSIHHSLKDFMEIPSLAEAISKWQVVKFADKLKDIVCLLTGCTRNDLEDREFKEQELPESWWYWVHAKAGFMKIIPYSEKSYDETKYRGLILQKPTYRYLLQYIGTDLFRNRLHPDTWVNATFSDYKPPKLSEYNPSQWLISDVRFPNEVDAIKERGGIVIKINRNNNLFKSVVHESETALDNYDNFDYIIDNNGTIEELTLKVREILVKENII